MKKIILLPLLFLSHYIFAQSVEVKWGKDYGKEGYRYEPIAINKQGNFIVCSEAFFKALGNLHPKKTKDQLNLANVQRTANHYYAWNYSYDASQKKMLLKFLGTDENGNPIGSGKLVASNDFDAKYKPSFSPIMNEIGQLSASNDNKTLAFLSSDRFVANGQPEIFYITVFDENLNILWQKKQEFPYKDKEFNALKAGIYVSNSGKVVISTILDQDKSTKKGTPDIYTLFIIDANGMKETKLNLGSQSALNSFLVTDFGNNDMLIVGTYYNLAYPANATAGTFTAKLSITSGSISSKSLSPFKAETIDQMGTVKDNAIYNFGLRSLLQTPSGNAVLVLGSSRSVQMVNAMGDASYTHSYTISHGNVIVKLNDDLKPAFETAVQNHFMSNSRSYSSTDVYLTGNKILLLYNSKTKQSDVNNQFMYSFCDLDNGKLSEEKEIPLSHKAYFFSPDASFQLSDAQIVIGAAPSDANGYTPTFVYGLLTVK